MRYDDYRNRILKIARVFQWIRKHTVLVVLILTAVAGLVGTTLALKGTILWNQYPEDMIYGDTPSPRTVAFLSSISYEYRDENGDWTSTTPKMPGNYKIRSVGKGLFGNPRYGDVGSFSITPKKIEVKVGTNQVVYGEMPGLWAETAFADRLECEQFVYEDILQVSTVVTPVQSAIRILSKDNEDVTQAYEITVVDRLVSILPRSISVTVEDTSQVYDGTRLSYDQYAITAGTLANGDVLHAVFSKSQTDVGSVVNQPSLRIVTKDAEDITHHYQINEIIGKLTVTQRPLIVTSQSISTTYNGRDVSNGNWTVSHSTPLVSGQSFHVHSTASFTDAGIYQNSGVFRILDSSGKDTTQNYSIFIEESTIEIIPKQIYVTTPTEAWEYDGTAHRATSLSISGLVGGHTYKVLESASIESVGTLSNNVRFQICDGNKDVSKSYDIQLTLGTLTVTKRPITVRPQDVSEYYCGEPILGGDAIISATSPRQLVDGHRLVSVSTDSLTNVGTATSTLTSVKVMDQNQDVTENYAIQTQKGSITVVKRPICIVVTDVEKVYDSTPLTSTNYTVVPVDPLTVALVSDHRIDGVVMKGSQTEVGSSENRLTDFTILDKSNVNQSQNYDVTVENGTLTVTKRPFKIVVQDATKVYDGTPLTSNKYDVLPVSPLTVALITGHKIANVVIQGSQTEVGSSENCLTDFTILDRSNKDQSKNYEVTIENGILTVTKKPITVLSGSAEKMYDGTPLVCHDPITIAAGALASGHSLDMRATGKQIDVGTSDNFIDGDILDSAGNAVTDNYEITFSLGTLRVYTNSVTNDPVVLKVMSDKSEMVYLRLQSYGDYIGKDNWISAPAYSKLLNGKYSYQYLTGIALENAGYESASIHIQSYTDCYPLPYFLSQGTYNYQIQTDDTACIGPALAQYSLTYYSYAGNGLDLTGYLGSFSDEELQYRAFVYDNYLTVDNETKAFMQQIIESQDFDPNDPAIIEKVAHYIKSAAVYDDSRSAQLDEESNMIIAFLNEYKTGVCRHYAAAATALYRSLGIPARYTVGFAKKTVANEWVNINIGHAWTEIYVDGVGWIPIEVTASIEGSGGSGGSGESDGSGGSGESEVEKPSIIISPAYASKQYDGTPLVASNQLNPCKELDKLLQLEFTYEVTVTGSQTQVGKGESQITEFRLYNAQRTDVTDKYNIICQKGILEVLDAEVKLIHVYLYQLQKYYDGTELAFGPDDYEIDGIASGHRLELDLHISLTEVGSISLSEIQEKRANYATFRVFAGSVDVTDLYALSFEAPTENAKNYVPIRIDPRRLEITANSVSKEDDGTPLTPQGATLTLGSLAVGHELLPLTVKGYQSGVGSSACYVDRNCVTILDQYSKNVTKNYDISFHNGTLEIHAPTE